MRHSTFESRQAAWRHLSTGISMLDECRHSIRKAHNESRYETHIIIGDGKARISKSKDTYENLIN